MPEHAVHPWFESTTNTTLTSHNGWYKRKKGQAGSLEAFRQAYAQGYRWMQIDAVPIKGDLISGHVMFGFKAAQRNKTFEEVRQTRPHVVRISTVLNDDKLKDVYWNIEIKSKVGRQHLLDLLGDLKANDRDLSTIMVSSPVRPSILREVATQYPEVALAAPLWHGGVLGVRFFGARRALVNGKPYNCQQCWYRLFGRHRSPAAKGDRPLRQLWTIGKRKHLHFKSQTAAHMIVDSESVALPYRDTGRIKCDPAKNKKPTLLALGGGGFRGAFGGIGTILYFDHRKLWADISQVVGISGGAFAVAALSAQPDDDHPVEAMTALFGRLERASRMVSRIVVVGVILAVPIIWLIVWGLTKVWHVGWWAVLLVVAASLLSIAFLVRSFITTYWKVTLWRLYESQTMRQQAAPLKRYRIGATGMSDGNLYSYSSDLACDREPWEKDMAGSRDRWDRNHDLAVPVPLKRDKAGNHCPRKLSDAVLRASSLPGIGQWGHRTICLSDHASEREHTDDCQVPDRLIDGGISGMFGRGLIAFTTAPDASQPATDFQPADEQLLVIVDAGRALQVRGGRTYRDRVLTRVEGVSTIVLLARWLAIAMDVAYRGELNRVGDGKFEDGYETRLVRLAEEEHKKHTDVATLDDVRQLELNRLTMLRDLVHSMSLLKASRGWANRAVTVAVAACALEFDEEQYLEQILHDIGSRLTTEVHSRRKSVGDLSDVWKKVPVLGKPVRVTKIDAPVAEQPVVLQTA